MWETIDDECCTFRVYEFSFGGTLASLEDEIAPLFHFDIAFGGLGCHPLSLDVILEARVWWTMWFQRWLDRLRLMAWKVCTQDHDKWPLDSKNSTH
jgi:hypothetical protein